MAIDRSCLYDPFGKEQLTPTSLNFGEGRFLAFNYTPELEGIRDH